MITPPIKDGAVELKSLSARAGSTAILPQDVEQVGSSSRERTRMVVGITSDQTCLVLNGRLRRLRLAGFDVTLVSSPGKLLAHTVEEEGIGAWPVPMSREISVLADLRSFLVLCWVLLRLRPILTDFSTPKAGLLGNVAAWLLRVPHRVYTLRGLKLERSKGWKQKVLLCSERLAAACADVVLCNSESLRDAAVGWRIAPPEKLKVLGHGSSNGVDTELFCPGESQVRADLGIGKLDSVLGFVGRLTNDKGIPELLLAFDTILSKKPSCWLLLVGWYDEAEDALAESWKSWIAAHPRICHVGRVTDTVIYFRAMDLLILPTHREGFPNVALEAAACAVPVITTDSTGARDAVLPELTGLLIPPGFPEAISEAALELLGGVTRRERMGRAARAWVEERYSREHVLELAVEFYRGMVAGKK